MPFIASYMQTIVAPCPLSPTALGRWFRSGTCVMVTITKATWYGVHCCRHGTAPPRTAANLLPPGSARSPPYVPIASACRLPQIAAKPRDVIHPHSTPASDTLTLLSTQASTTQIITATHRFNLLSRPLLYCPTNPHCSISASPPPPHRPRSFGRRRFRRHLGVPRLVLWLSPGGAAVASNLDSWLINRRKYDG